MRAGGTSALRGAENRGEFLDRVEGECGLRVRVLSGPAEAALTLRGIVWDLSRRPGGVPPRWIGMDPGGGSTELSAVERDRPCLVRSLPLGTVTLTERHLRSDPPRDEEVGRVRRAVVEGLRPFYNSYGMLGWTREGVEMVGTAATVTALAALDLGSVPPGGEDALSGAQLSRPGVERLVERLSRMSAPERSALPGIDRGREDVIVAGAVLVERTMSLLGFDSLTVAVGGLLEGLLLDEKGES